MFFFLSPALNQHPESVLAAPFKRLTPLTNCSALIVPSSSCSPITMSNLENASHKSLRNRQLVGHMDGWSSQIIFCTLDTTKFWGFQTQSLLAVCESLYIINKYVNFGENHIYFWVPICCDCCCFSALCPSSQPRLTASSRTIYNSNTFMRRSS